MPSQLIARGSERSPKRNAPTCDHGCVCGGELYGRITAEAAGWARRSLDSFDHYALPLAFPLGDGHDLHE